MSEREKLYPPKCSMCGHPIHGDATVTMCGNVFIMRHKFDCMEIKKRYDKHVTKQLNLNLTEGE